MGLLPHLTPECMTPEVLDQAKYRLLSAISGWQIKITLPDAAQIAPCNRLGEAGMDRLRFIAVSRYSARIFDPQAHSSAGIQNACCSAAAGP